MKNFRVINGELFEADSTEEGEVNLYPDMDIANEHANIYRNQGCKSCILRNAASECVVYFHRKRTETPKISLSRRFKGKIYLPERTAFGSIVIRYRDNALRKVEYYRDQGYNCKIVDYLMKDDLVIIYMRCTNMEMDSIFNVVFCED